MAANNNLSTLNGLFKETYGDKVENIIPENVKLLKQVAFVSKDKQNGNLYHQPVILGLEHGVSYAVSGDAFALNNAVAGQIKDAQVQGAQHVLRSVLSYAAASRALAAGPSAFESATKFLVGNMLRSISRKIEIDLLYGNGSDTAVTDGCGLASISAVAALQFTVALADWAPGIWAGAEGMPINFRTAAGVSNGTADVSTVNLDTRVVTYVNLVGAGPSVADFVFAGGSHAVQMAGLNKIMRNTGSLFNISASTYNLWKSNEYDAGSAALSFTKINNAIARGVEKGLDQDVKVLVNPKGWANLLSDQAALRRFDSSWKKDSTENGSQSIKFYGQNGMVEIEPSIFVKEGMAYIVVMDDLMRIGSSDVTFKRPGQGDDFFRDLENSAAYELRCYSDQALFSHAPGRMILMKNIVNS